ncbi:MAG TPA: hypothetical protein VGL21_06750 [Jatrophihabitantaceae bacterium]|jgi:hypothetical protein
MPAPARLACPHCGCDSQLRTVELLEALAHVTFTAGSDTPTYLGESDLLWDTQQWPDGGAIVCRNCDQVDLRLNQLVPASTRGEDDNSPVPAPGRAAPIQPQGATS